ncbi:MAG TPA: universal stress protein [Polyangiaceae bacterium]|nr:universal stress protein [Polyangiaceae bacterium]
MTTFKHILVPTDFSPSSADAIELAIEMATRFDAELTLLHVWELPVYPYMELIINPAELTASIEKAAAECLASKLKEVHARLPRARSKLSMGIPWREIVAAINESKADLLIMGTHGRRGLEHAIMGSVAEKLVRLSPIPVLTVRGTPAH